MVALDLVERPLRMTIAGARWRGSGKPNAACLFFLIAMVWGLTATLRSGRVLRLTDRLFQAKGLSQGGTRAHSQRDRAGFAGIISQNMFCLGQDPSFCNAVMATEGDQSGRISFKDGSGR